MKMIARNLLSVLPLILGPWFPEYQTRNRLRKIIPEIILGIENVGDIPEDNQGLLIHFESLLKILKDACKKIQEDAIHEKLKGIFPANERFIHFVLFYKNKTSEDLLKQSKLIDEVNRISTFLRQKFLNQHSLVECIDKELGLAEKKDTQKILREIEEEYSIQV